MLYLLDANALIRADADYYPLGRVPPFWDWLLMQAQSGKIKMPFEIYDEIASASGPLKDWITDPEIRKAVILEEEVDPDIFNEIIDLGYAADLNDTEQQKIGRDPFLIAYARMGSDRIVVTKEVSRPAKLRANRKVPDICDHFGVQWVDDFELYRILDFKVR